MTKPIAATLEDADAVLSAASGEWLQVDAEAPGLVADLVFGDEYFIDANPPAIISSRHG